MIGHRGHYSATEWAALRRSKILAWLAEADGTFSAVDVRAAAPGAGSASLTTVHADLRQLERDGLVERDSRGRWRVR